MVLYRAKQTKDVYLLFPMHISSSVNEKDKKKRLDSALHYNFTKRDVNTADEMLRCYSTKAASRRCPLTTFFNRLPIVALGTFIITKNPGMTPGNKCGFLIKLGETSCAA